MNDVQCFMDGILSTERTPATKFQVPNKLVSILLCTVDRFELTQKCVGSALARADYPYELLSVDNGSTDKRVIEYIASLYPVYHRVNPDNQGYARMLNQMLLRAKGDYLCIIDNDLMMPDAWLRKLVEVNERIPNSGISGYHCVEALAAPEVRNGCEVHVQEPIHGCKFFSKVFLGKVGYLCGDFHRYGNEDVEYNRRSIMAGFVNYYLGAGDRIQHLGEDAKEKTDYREMKWKDLRGVGHPVLMRRFQELRDTGDFYLPPPEAN